MRDYQVIQKIRQLRQIKPNSDWVLLTKQQALEKIEVLSQKETKEQRHWFPLPRPVLLTGVVGVAVLFVIAIFAVGNLNILPVPVELSPADYDVLISSLNTLEKTLVQATDNLKKMEGPESVLEVKQAVDGAIKDGEKFVSQARRIKKSSQPKEKILTALSEVESALSEMKETSEGVQKEIASREIEGLKQRSLSEVQEKLLQEAEDFFQKGRYEKALEKIIEASQNH